MNLIDYIVERSNADKIITKGEIQTLVKRIKDLEKLTEAAAQDQRRLRALEAAGVDNWEGGW